MLLQNQSFETEHPHTLRLGVGSLHLITVTLISMYNNQESGKEILPQSTLVLRKRKRNLSSMTVNNYHFCT